MNTKTKLTHELPGSKKEKTEDDGIVNDSLGTVDIGDSTGSEEEKDNGDGKKGNTNTRED
jgi:hypothetical protein